MEQELQKALELIEKSEQISLALPSRPTFDNLVAAEVLIRYLESQKKQVGIFAALDPEEKTDDILKSLKTLSR